MIEEYIRMFGPIESAYCDREMESLDVILNEWSKKKKNLCKLLGNNLILRRPYAYITESDALLEELQHNNRFEEKPYTDFKYWWNRNVTIGFYETYPDLWGLAATLITPYTLVHNQYEDETKIFVFPDEEKYKVSKGMRPMRIISKIAQKYHCDERLLEDFRIWHSQLLNTQRMDGELCLSIHPLDYMTMSDNDNGWSSCMNWRNPGDYRCGTVECMNSPFIVIAYLHSPKHTMKIKNIDCDWEWNSKRWRELFIIHPEVITEIKGYCFQDENLTNTALMWIKELAHNNLGWDYDDDEININSTYKFDEKHDLSFRFYPDNYMYNDFGTLDLHRARINREKIGKYQNTDNNIRGYMNEWQTPRDDKWHYMLELPYGGKATCMWCGSEIEDKDRDNAVMCSRCDGGVYCTYCGDYIPSYNKFYVDELDGPICESCYDYECTDDDLTEERHLTNNMTYIRWLIGYDSFDDPIYHDITLSVYEPEQNDAYLRIFKNAPHRRQKGYSFVNYITLDDVIDIEAFKDIFEIDGEIEDVVNQYSQS